MESVRRESTRDGISLWGKEDRPLQRWDDEELKKALQQLGGGQEKLPPHEGERTQISI